MRLRRTDANAIALLQDAGATPSQDLKDSSGQERAPSFGTMLPLYAYLFEPPALSGTAFRSASTGERGHDQGHPGATVRNDCHCCVAAPSSSHAALCRVVARTAKLYLKTGQASTPLDDKLGAASQQPACREGRCRPLCQMVRLFGHDAGQRAIRSGSSFRLKLIVGNRATVDRNLRRFVALLQILLSCPTRLQHRREVVSEGASSIDVSLRHRLAQHPRRLDFATSVRHTPPPTGRWHHARLG